MFNKKINDKLIDFIDYLKSSADMSVDFHSEIINYGDKKGYNVAWGDGRTVLMADDYFVFKFATSPSGCQQNKQERKTFNKLVQDDAEMLGFVTEIYEAFGDYLIVAERVTPFTEHLNNIFWNADNIETELDEYLSELMEETVKGTSFDAEWFEVDTDMLFPPINMAGVIDDIELRNDNIGIDAYGIPVVLDYGILDIWEYEGSDSFTTAECFRKISNLIMGINI